MAADGDADRALDVVASMWRSWHLRSHLDEGRRFVEELVETAGPRAGVRSRARADLCLGNLAYWQTRYEQALVYYTRAAAHFRELNDPAGLAEATYDQGFALHLVGRTGQGQASFEEARKRYRSLGDAVGEANAAAGLAFGLCNLGRLVEAAELAEESLRVLREQGDPFSIANTVGLLGMVHRAQGHLERAEPLLGEALATHSAANHSTGVVWMLRGLRRTRPRPSGASPGSAARGGGRRARPGPAWRLRHRGHRTGRPDRGDAPAAGTRGTTPVGGRPCDLDGRGRSGGTLGRSGCQLWPHCGCRALVTGVRARERRWPGRSKRRSAKARAGASGSGWLAGWWGLRG